MKTRVRYETIKGHPGIRRDTNTGKLLATKKIKGKAYSSTFERLLDAKHWKNTFIPIEERIKTLKMTFGELRLQYVRDHLSTLAASTRGVRLDRLKIYDPLNEYEVEDLSPEIINRFFMKETAAAKLKNSRRMNFHGEIKDLNAILNWYRETYNYRYAVPVMTKKLKAISTISKEKRIKEKLSGEEFLLFFNQLPELYKDVALVQSRVAGRISETVGIQFKCVNFKERFLWIKYAVVYGRRKEFLELKLIPKEGDKRKCFLTDDLNEVLNKRFKLKHPDSDFVFHINGMPLKYRAIQHAYDHALTKAGLRDKTSGTHMLRHFTATMTRQVCGNLDAVQAVTGHKSMKLVQHYGELSKALQGDSIARVETYLNSLSKTELSS